MMQVRIENCDSLPVTAEGTVSWRAQFWRNKVVFANLKASFWGYLRAILLSISEFSLSAQY
jgi:hypothetical protein